MIKLSRTLLCGFALALTSPAPAQTWPARPIRWIAPYPPGGAIDAIARLVAGPLSANLGQTVIVENRVGAGGMIGTDAVAKAAPDGYTIGVGDVGPLTYYTSLYKKLPYDPVRDLLPVGLYARIPLFISSGENSGIRSITELIAAARERPGKITYASSGIGSPQHLTMELLKNRAGIDLVHIPYKGAGPVMQDFLAGRVDIASLTLLNVRSNIASGKVRPLASTDVRRNPLLPDVPTVAEAAVPDFSVVVWYTLIAPAGTPKEIVARLNQELRKAMASPEVVARYPDYGAEVAVSSPEEAAEVLKKERAVWGPLISRLGIALD